MEDKFNLFRILNLGPVRMSGLRAFEILNRQLCVK